MTYGHLCSKPPQPTATLLCSWALGAESLDTAQGDGWPLLHEAQGLSWGLGWDDARDWG